MLKAAVAEQLKQSTKQLNDETNAHTFTKKELAETKKELAEAKNAIQMHEKHIDELKSKIDGQSQQINYLVDKFHQFDSQDDIKKKKKLNIMKAIMLTAAFIGLYKIMNK